MFKLCCAVTILTSDNKTVFYDYVSEIEIDTSVDHLTDTAKVTVPRNITFNGQDIREFVSRGDSITIALGYDGNLQTIFKGYVKTIGNNIGKSVRAGVKPKKSLKKVRIAETNPLVIECENEAWKLKQMTVQPAHYPKLELSAWCNANLPYTVSIPTIQLGEVIIKEACTMADVLDYFMKNYPVNFFFKDGKFYGILQSAMQLADGSINTVNFAIGENVVSENLTYVLAEDLNVQIIAKAILKDNTKLEYKYPENVVGPCDIRTFLVPGATSMSDVQQYAKDKLGAYKVDKMEGDFTAFGVPHVRKGDIVHLKDDYDITKDDKNFISKSVKYKFGQQGYRQVITLGMQITI
jgi:hypothetical protein